MSKKLTPMKAKTVDRVCELKRNWIEDGDFCMGVSWASVYISEQATGENSKDLIPIPRAVFDKMVRWYVTGSKCGALG